MNAIRPQYVNLYLKPTGWARKSLKARSVASALLALMVGLAALSAYSGWRVARFESEASKVAQQLGQRDARLADVLAGYRALADFQALQARVARLTRLLATQDVVFKHIEDASLGSRRGFSQQLSGIARATVAGIWVTQLELGAAPVRFRLGGVAMSPDLLPRYLTSLGAQSTVGVKRLQSLTVDNSVTDQKAAAQGAVAFSIVQSEGDRQDSL